MYTFTMPSGQEVELRELTGVEESLITNRRLMQNGEGVDKVLFNCIVRIGDREALTQEDIMNLLSGDRMFVLVRLREISIGNEVELILTCPNANCGEEELVGVNIEELKVTPYGPEREHTIKLPRSGETVRYRLLDGKMERRLSDLQRQDKNMSIHAALLMRIIDVDGKPPTKMTTAQMVSADLNALRHDIQRHEGGIDTQVRANCPVCGAKIVTRLEAEPTFLFPEARS